MALSVVLEISQLVEGVAKAEAGAAAAPPPEPNDRIIVETEERCITLLLEAAAAACIGGEAAWAPAPKFEAATDGLEA